MDRMNEISNYVNNLKIKKTFFGGYDREDVYVKFQELTELFQKYIEEDKEKQKAQIEEYELRLQTGQMLISELNKKLSVLAAEQRDIEQEKDKMKEVYREYCSNVLKQYSDSLRSLSAEFTQILDNITSLQQNILETEIFEGFETVIEEKEVEALPEKKEEEDE